MKKIILVFFVASTLLVVASYRKAPHFIEEKLYTFVQENCSTCVLKIGSIKPTFSGLTFKNIYFYQGDPLETSVETSIPYLIVNFNFMDVLLRRFHITSVFAESPQVDVVEGDLSGKRSEPPSDKKALFRIDDIEVDHARFSYTRVHKGRKAPIRIDKIQAHVNAIGTTPELIDQMTTGEVKAILENSGKIDLKVSAYVFQNPSNISVDLKIDHLTLDRMNPYFETSDGVKLQGHLIEGRSEVSIKKELLYSYVQAEYKDLGLNFKKTDQRTELAAFFSTLLGKIKLNSKNLDQKEDQQIQYTDIKRKNNESIVSYILRGMKEAALKVAAKK